jgi:predicted transcriptional regulator
MTIIEKVQSIHNMESRIIELLKNAEDKYKKIRNNRELDELDKMGMIALSEESGKIKAYKELILQFNLK